MPTRFLHARRALPLLSSVALLACSSANTADPTDAGFDASPADAGASDATSAPSGSFGCVSAPSETTLGTNTVSVTLKLFDDTEPVTTDGPNGGSDFTTDTFTPLSGITVSTCAGNDPGCATPTGPSPTSDATGEVTFSLQESFNGVFGLSGSGHVPTTLYPGRLLAGATSFAPPVGLISTTEAANVGTVLGTTFETDPAKGLGHLFVQVYDCADRHAAGIAFTMNYVPTSETVAWYGKGELPSATATATDALGLGGVLNIGAGKVLVTATEVATKLVVGQIEVFIVAGSVTTAWIRPRTH